MSNFEIDQKVIRLCDSANLKVGGVYTVSGEDGCGGISIKEDATYGIYQSYNFMPLEPTTPFGELSTEEKKKLVWLYLDGTPLQYSVDSSKVFYDCGCTGSVAFGKYNIFRVKPNNSVALDKLSVIAEKINKLKEEAKEIRKNLF